MTYKEKIQLIANSGVSEIERGENLIRSMSKVIEEIMNYKYTYDHYGGDSEEVLKDKANAIKNATAVMVTDADILMTALGLSDAVIIKAKNRVDKIVIRVYGGD